MWTVAKVKHELPHVAIRISRRIVTGRTSGRLNPFCTVTVWNEGTLHCASILYKDWHFSWEAIAHSLNTGIPLDGECPEVDRICIAE